ncbi:MAG: DUF2178 domain-containing protein [Candidatus Nanoarchaeia archaeon]
MKPKTNHKTNKIRLLLMLVISLIVIATLALFWFNAFRKGDISGGILGILIGVSILAFAIFIFKKGNKDMREGYPLEDERSKRVKEKASSRAFYVSLYVLLLIGLLSDNIINFRDASQAISTAVGGMALLFAAFWAYYNRKEI